VTPGCEPAALADIPRAPRHRRGDQRRGGGDRRGSYRTPVGQVFTPLDINAGFNVQIPGRVDHPPPNTCACTLGGGARRDMDAKLVAAAADSEARSRGHRSATSSRSSTSTPGSRCRSPKAQHARRRTLARRQTSGGADPRRRGPLCLLLGETPGSRGQVGRPTTCDTPCGCRPRAPHLPAFAARTDRGSSIRNAVERTGIRSALRAGPPSLRSSGTCRSRGRSVPGRTGPRQLGRPRRLRHVGCRFSFGDIAPSALRRWSHHKSTRT
jgi:hypothetical protein